jgi:uncharacterized protein YjiK
MKTKIILSLVFLIGLVFMFALDGNFATRAQENPPHIQQEKINSVPSFEGLNPKTPEAILNQAQLLNTIDTSQFSPPSPDPSGITFLPSSNTLLISDSEVNEMVIFEGANLFEVTLSGSLVNTYDTLFFSGEPTGLDYNPDSGHLFISDDNRNMIFEIALGENGPITDNVINSFDTTLFGSFDPEGVSFDSWNKHLFIADGNNGELYQLIPGDNGIYDGVPPEGDDQVVSFDTTELGLVDIEDVTFNTDNGHLYIISRGSSKNSVTETTTDGELVNIIDISAANARHPDGITFAPCSGSPTVKCLYIADRGVDNNFDPNENDGKIYEMSLPSVTPGNNPPEVSTAADQTIILPEIVNLNGTVSDDGIPDPPGAVDAFWASVQGPGKVNIDNVASLNTTATFSTAGTYVLRLFASDGELTNFDDMTVTVYELNYLPLISR